MPGFRDTRDCTPLDERASLMRMVTIRFDVRKLLAVVLGGIALWRIADRLSAPPPARTPVQAVPQAPIGPAPEPLHMERLAHLSLRLRGVAISLSSC